MRSKYELKQIVYVPFEIYAISEILRGDEASLLYQVRGTQDKGITITVTEDLIEKYYRKPERHGIWINKWSGDGSAWLEERCSECGVVFEDEPHSYKYCPNCGARMEEE